MNYLKTLKQRKEFILKRVAELETELIPLKKEFNLLNDLILVHEKEDNSSIVENDNYPLKSNVKDKIKFALSAIKAGTASDIEKFLKQYETDINSNTITIVSATMAKDNEIKAVKEGKANVYSLK